MSTIGCSHSEASTIKTPSTPVSVLGSLIHKLIKSWIDVVSKLYFRNWAKPFCCHANPETNDALKEQQPSCGSGMRCRMECPFVSSVPAHLFRQWSVKHSVTSKPLCQALSHSEHPSELHVLPENITPTREEQLEATPSHLTASTRSSAGLCGDLLAVSLQCEAKSVGHGTQ